MLATPADRSSGVNTLQAWRTWTICYHWCEPIWTEPVRMLQGKMPNVHKERTRHTNTLRLACITWEGLGVAGALATTHTHLVIVQFTLSPGRSTPGWQLSAPGRVMPANRTVPMLLSTTVHWTAALAVP